jgi:hypothetical protein
MLVPGVINGLITIFCRGGVEIGNARDIFATVTLPDSPAEPGPPLEPGQFVRHPGRADWGVGQVQSVVGARVTVNFEHGGKVLVNTRVVALAPVEVP